MQKVLNESNFQETWAVLHTAFDAIHQKNASELSFEVLYRTAYTLVLHKDGERLYNSSMSTIREHLQQVVRGDMHLAYQEVVGAPLTWAHEKQDAGVRFLKAVRNAWEDHTLCMKMIRDVLMYLVRVTSHSP